MIQNVPDPRGLSLSRWCAELALQDASVPYPPDPIHWRRWASEVVTFSSLASLSLPDPRAFGDWRGWATRVRELVGR